MPCGKPTARPGCSHCRRALVRVCERESRNTLLFSTLYWMNRRGFAAPTLLNPCGHWVAIVGRTTNVELLAGSSPVLQSIDYHDPEPVNVGIDTMMTAAQWYGGPFNGAVMYGGTWLNKYVAIVEPSHERTGRREASETHRVTDTPVIGTWAAVRLLVTPRWMRRRGRIFEP